MALDMMGSEGTSVLIITALSAHGAADWY